MSSALVTDAPTLALAQVLERMKSVRTRHRMSILRLFVARGAPGRITVANVSFKLGGPGDLGSARNNLIKFWSQRMHALYGVVLELRTWDHFSVIVKIENEEGSERLGGLDPEI